MVFTSITVIFSCVLAFAGPVLAFSGVNRAACTSRQIIFSVILAVCLGSLFAFQGIRHRIGGVPKETAILLKKHAYTALERDSKLLKEHEALFDENFYKQAYTQLTRYENPVMHFYHYSVLLALQPNPLFDTTFAFISSQVHAVLGRLPLADFFAEDTASGCLPSLTFWPAAWQHPECTKADTLPMLNCLQHGKYL